MVLVLVAILLVACTRNQPNATHRPTPSPAPSKVAWSDCGAGFQCGTLQVPLDYANPQGRKISLALMRKPATQTADRIGSLLMNPGGPGESGIDFMRSDIRSLSESNAMYAAKWIAA